MSLLALTLFSFGVTDILWSISGSTNRPGLPEAWQPLTGTLFGIAVAASLGVSGLELVLVAAGLFAVTVLWWHIGKVGTPSRACALLGFFGLASLVALVAGGFVSSEGGWFAAWYEGWNWSLEDSASVDQFVFLTAALLFSTISANRIVSSVLWVAGTPPQHGEVRLKGGRILGPMERWIVIAMILAGQPAGVAIVFAAKGLLRFPTLNSDDSSGTEMEPETVWSSADYSEYFLVGTFASLIVAALSGATVLAIS